jgi:RNA polymerase sigma-70 factor (ECF subfamily)
VSDTPLAELVSARITAPSPSVARAWEEQLRRLWERGRAAWPGLEVSAQDFVHHLLPHWPAEGDGAAFLAALHGEDLYLCCACARGVAAALLSFDRSVLASVPAFVVRVDPSPAFADEVRQILRTRLLLAKDGAPPRIAGYSGSGPLASWVRIAAVRTALNLRRNRDDRPKDEVDDTTVGHIAQAPEVELLRAQHRQTFHSALREAFLRLSPADRNLLRMHFAGGLTGERIAGLLQVNRSTVVRGLARIRMELFQEVRRQLRDRLRLPPSELDSFIRILRSHFNLSLTSLLKEDR